MNITKKQHIVPRSYLKNFCNNDNKFWAYNYYQNGYTYINYFKACSQSYAYESENIVDNILENKISKIEAPAMAEIKKIIDNICDIKRQDIDEQILWKFTFLQLLRTNSGRKTFIHHFRGNNDIITKPYTIEELKNSDEEFEEFNKLFKQNNLLEDFLDYFKLNKQMTLKIEFSRNFKYYFLTSDNPVITIYGNSIIPLKEIPFQFILPICPEFALVFNLYDYPNNTNNNLFAELTDEKMITINRYQIESANYYIISRQRFNFPDMCAIYYKYHD